MRSPLCAPGARAALGAAEQRACARTGSPLSGAPTTHYAYDIEWNPSITHPADVAVKALYSLLDMLWLALLFAVRGVLTLLDWAFTLNPFALGAAGGLQRALARFFAVVDAGYLSAVIAALGLWGIWSGIARRRTPETIGGLAAALAMLVLAVAVVHAPDRTAGLVARLANQSAMGLMAAPSHGLGAAPVATYGEAVDGLFDDVVRAPWCALQFRTRAFCDGTAERGAVQAALDAARDDGDSAPAIAPGARVPRGELWLAFAPGSDARTALHDYYGGHDGGKVGALGVTIVNTGIGDKAGHDPGEVAIQGGAGSLVRLPLLVVVVVGVLGALLVVGWIMLRLLDQATTGFVLLLFTPVALLLVAFGEAGRAAFARWGLALLGALVSKVVYAVMLGVVVLGARLLAAGADAGDWMLAWLLQTAFWWSVFLKRAQLVGYLSVVPAFDGSRAGRRLGGLLAFRALSNARREHDGALRGRALRSRVARSEGVRAAAREHVDARADQRAAQHDRDAADVVARDASLRTALDALTLGGEASHTHARPDPDTGATVTGTPSGDSARTGDRRPRTRARRARGRERCRDASGHRRRRRHGAGGRHGAAPDRDRTSRRRRAPARPRRRPTARRAQRRARRARPAARRRPRRTPDRSRRRPARAPPRAARPAAPRARAPRPRPPPRVAGRTQPRRAAAPARRGPGRPRRQPAHDRRAADGRPRRPARAAQRPAHAAAAERRARRRRSPRRAPPAGTPRRGEGPPAPRARTSPLPVSMSSHAAAAVAVAVLVAAALLVSATPSPNRRRAHRPHPRRSPAPVRPAPAQPPRRRPTPPAAARPGRPPPASPGPRHRRRVPARVPRRRARRPRPPRDAARSRAPPRRRSPARSAPPRRAGRRAAPGPRAPGVRALDVVGPAAGRLKVIATLDRAGRTESLELHMRRRRRTWRVAGLG